MIKVDKKQDKLWAKRMHTSLKCYKENLITLYALEKKIAAFEANEKKVLAETQNINLDDEDTLVRIAESSMTSLLQQGNNTQADKRLIDDNTTYLIEKLKGMLF